MDGSVAIGAGWWCWLEVPAAYPGWAASPVFIESVEPLKTGKSLLRLSFVQAIHPVAARQREVVLRVLFRGASHLVGTLADDDRTVRTAILAAPDYGWLKTYCPLLWRRRRPNAPAFFVAGQPPPPGPTPTEYLDATFGRAPDQILRGASADSFGKQHSPVGSRHGLFRLDQTYSPFDSWMIARGFVPTVMEEKWFIYMEAGRLLFRRSWTGILIYDVEATWCSDQLHLGEVRVNRNPDQHEATDDEYDRQLLGYLIAVVLLGEDATFPMKDESSPDKAALPAWSLAGKASL